MNPVYSVSKITLYIKTMFMRDGVLPRVTVEGEVSNLKYHSSGHIYFTLKDSGAQLRCTMFRDSRRNGLAFPMQEGDKVQVLGRIGVFERDGIYQLMDRERPYLRSELKLSDVAEKLGVSSRVLSDCIRNSTGNTFANFINAYRIDHAKQLMRTQPDIKISEVFLSSGFANETTFFRIFKAVTGMTPTEWKRID